MKLSNIVYGAIGYTLGARAGRGRYDQIVRISRRVGGSQTVQATAGVVQARIDRLTAQAKQAIAARLGASGQQPADAAANGHRSP